MKTEKIRISQIVTNVGESQCDRFDDGIHAKDLTGSAPITLWTGLTHGVNKEATITLSACAKYGHSYNLSHFLKLDKVSVSQPNPSQLWSS